MNQPAAADWLAAWEFAHASPDNSVRLTVRDIRCRGREGWVVLVQNGGECERWGVSPYPRDDPVMSCMFGLSRPLRGLPDGEHLSVRVVDDKEQPVEHGDIEIELVTLPEVK